MNAVVQQRLQIEYDQVQNAMDEGVIEDLTVDLAMKNNAKDYYTWNVIIYGKEGTIWEGGEFPGVLKFPDTYPRDPPSYFWQTFDERFYHMNIHSNAWTCIDILKPSIGYTPSRTCVEIFKAIEGFLYHPNPRSICYHEICVLFKDNKAEYEKRTREFVKRFMQAKEKAEKK